MPKQKHQAVILPDSISEYLTRLSRQRNTSVNFRVRSEMLLALRASCNNKEVARGSNLSYKGLSRMRMRWLSYEASLLAIEADEALEAKEKNKMLHEKIAELLSDKPRSGCPARITAEEYCKIMAVSLSPPTDFDRPITHWSRRELAEEVIKQGVVPTISASQVGRFFKRSRPQTA